MWDLAGGFLARSIHYYSWSRRGNEVSDNDGHAAAALSLEINLKSSLRELLSSVTTQKLDCINNVCPTP